MQGPFAIGTCENITMKSRWEKSRVTRGQRYRVTKPFVDADGDEHPIGEEWYFIASMFSPYFDELMLCVRSLTGEDWRLILRREPEREVVDNFLTYVSPVASA